MNKIERYKQAAVDAIGDMSKAGAEAKAAYVKAERDEHGAQNAFNEGITGRTGLANRMETIKADKDRAEKAMSDAFEKAREAVSEAREVAFTIDPADVPDGLFEVLGGCLMTPDEYAAMVTTYKGESNTAVRAVITAAKRNGLDVEDNAPAFIEDVESELDAFADYCHGMAVTTAYDGAWGGIVADSVSSIETAYAGYMAAPWA